MSRSSKVKGWLHPGLGLAAVALTVGCGARVRIGVVLPETGAAAVYGAPIKSGLQLAFDQAVAAGTIPGGFEVIYRDSGSEPTRAALATEALFEAGARVVIGGATTAEAMTVIPVADRWHRVVLSPSASAPELGGRSTYFFRVYPSDALEGVQAANLFVASQTRSSVLILEEDNDYTRGLLPVFVRELTARGGRVFGPIRLAEPAWQKALLETLKAARPSGIYICAYSEASLSALRAVRNAGFAGIVCVTSAITPAAVLQRAGSVADGVFLPLASWDDASREMVRSFIRRYSDTFRMAPDTFAAHGYDAGWAILHALVQPECRDGRDLRVCLRALAGREGVTGPFAFDNNGNINHAPRIHCVRRGKIELCDSSVTTGDTGRSAR
jgi:branched-chain amino acid transport system substrate-binding protein